MWLVLSCLINEEYDDDVTLSLDREFHADIVWGKKENLNALVWAKGGSTWSEWEILKLGILFRIAGTLGK